jgi:hypothetical protein
VDDETERGNLSDVRRRDQAPTGRERDPRLDFSKNRAEGVDSLGDA